VQMVTWMSYHDAVQCYKVFLCWVKGEGIVDDDNDEVEPKRKWWQVDNDKEEHVHGHKVAKVPSYGNVTVDTLINEYHAMDKWFTWYLEGFLLAHSFPIPPSHNVPFRVFKCLTVTLCQIPQVSDHLTMTGLSDMIRMIFPEPPQG
jgi:hypothetical protein